MSVFRVAVLLLLIALGCWLGPARADEPGQVQQPEMAAFSEGPCAGALAQLPQPLSLPDLWPARGQRTPATGCYQLRVAAPEVGALQAISIEGFSSTHRVWLNDQLIAARGVEQGHAARTIPASRLIDVPASLWQRGENRISIEVFYSSPSRAGLGRVSVGPAAGLREAYEWRRSIEVELPAAINLAAAVLAVLLLSIWAARREERALGLLGLLFLVGSLRNYAYARESALLSQAFSEWLFFAAQVWTATLFALFVIELDGARRRGVVPVVLAVAAGVSVLGALATSIGLLPLARSLVYPVLLASLVLQTGWLGSMAAMRRSPLLAGLTLSLMAVVVSGAHDYLAVTGRDDVATFYWLPLSMPAVLAVCSVLLVRRFVRAMNVADSLNRTLERRVGERTAELEAANAAKSSFLAAASHDLRQPLHAMGMLVGSMVWSGGAAGDPRLARLQGMIEQLEGLLSGVLDLSRIEAGAVQPRLQTCALAPLLQDVCQEAATLAQEKGLQLRLHDTARGVVTDPVMLRACLANLVGNAIKYTARGGVLVGCRVRGSLLRIEVHDTGQGLDAEQLARVFGEFYRARPEDASVPGFGLGLAIVDRYARLLGHRIDVRSMPGRGSCFAIELPLVEAPAARSDAGAALPLAMPSLQGAFVLLIDDDEVILAATRDLLQSWRCTVIAVSCRSTALSALSHHLRAPDLILADYRLATDTGVEVVERIRRTLGQAVPALIITADIRPEHLTRIRAAGLGLLQKPLAPARLYEAVARALNERRDAELRALEAQA